MKVGLYHYVQIHTETFLVVIFYTRLRRDNPSARYDLKGRELKYHAFLVYFVSLCKDRVQDMHRGGRNF